MLERVSRTPSFKRDWKRLRRKRYSEDELKAAILALMQENADTLRTRYRDHALTGQWQGFRELHVRGDWLLVYCVMRDELRLVLTRTGSHDDLFSRGSHVPDPQESD